MAQLGHAFWGVEVWDLIVGGWNLALQIGFILTLSDYVQVSSPVLSAECAIAWRCYSSLTVVPKV